MIDHTEGPWEIIPEKKNPLYCYIYDKARKHLGQICSVMDSPKSGNAHLIVSSPELLAACEAAYAEILPIDAAWAVTLRIKLNKAITKAKGRK
jgi:hypothetical protein